jgi:hypothetical protein
MMVAEQVQARVHRTEDLVDLRLACVGPSASRKRPEWLCRFVRHKDVDAAQPSACLDLFADEMSPLVGKFGRLRASLPGMRKIGSRRFVPGRRERPAESGYAQSSEIDRRGVRKIAQIAWKLACRECIEVVVVAVDEIDRRSDGLVVPLLVGEVTDAQPERNVRVPGGDRARRVEGAVNVA